MKKFIDSKGDFIILIPVEWSFKNPFYEATPNNPFSFELYENKIGTFQISCKPKDLGKIPVLTKANKLGSQNEGENNLEFTEKFTSSGKFGMYVWMALVQDKFLLCKYIYNKEDKEKDEIKNEIEKVRKSLKTIIVIKEENKENILASERFNKFMMSLMASKDLANRAYKNQSSIELVVLLANQIDALLRLSLILNKQIQDNTEDIDTTLLFQEENDRPIMEKEVYKMALDDDIIDQDLYDKLFHLYNQRNKVIHRYIITDLMTKDVMELAVVYSSLEEKIGEIVIELEQNQFKEKVGVYGTENPPDQTMDETMKDIIIGGLKEKHAHSSINDKITF